jgi:hypothetical protein
MPFLLVRLRTENWTKSNLKRCKTIFDKGKAWSLRPWANFSAIKTAWFDEPLNTQMKLCH